MRRIYVILTTLILSGCQFQNIEITGTAPGMDGSTVSVMTDDHKTLYGTNIQDGKFHIVQQVLEQPGYYELIITPPGKPMGLQVFEVYLEPGKYDIQVNKGESYPVIITSSRTQNELSVYRRFTDSANRVIRDDANNLMTQLNAPSAMALPQATYQVLLDKTKAAQEKQINAWVTTLDKFVTKYPKNGATVHAMAYMNFEENPAKFFTIYQKLDAGLKNSEEGKQIGDKLKSLNKLAPGSQAPAFAGETPDGKKINIKDLHKKIIIVALWRSGSGAMDEQQYALAHNLLPLLDSNKAGVISISFDTDRNKWLGSIKKSGLYHIQISDLKGDDSPNVNNWNANPLPNYYILDGQGKILYNNLSYQALAFSAKEYLDKH